MITRTVIDGREWLKIISAPRLKVLRIHLLGLTLGFATFLTHVIFAPWTEVRFLLSVVWFVIGYLFGFIFGQLYNYFVFLYLQILHPEWMKLWFYYDPNKEVNVIKTPTPDSDWDSLTHQLFKEAVFKVFDHQPYPAIKDPYTIVFVANPLLKTTRSGSIPDPIMNNTNLFLKAIERALFSFEFNHEVIGHRDIWSKIRIITVNPAVRMRNGQLTKENAEAALIEETEGNFDQSGGGTFSTFIVQPSTDEDVHMARFVRTALHTQGLKHITHIDLIYALTASTTHDRSSAEPATFSKETNRKHQMGEKFTFSIDPYCTKDGEILKSRCELCLCESIPESSEEDKEKYLDEQCKTTKMETDCTASEKLPRINGPDRVLFHEFYPPHDLIGRVAMSVLDVRDRLPVHEFGHAMSSVQNGIIVDEYYDYAFIADDPSFSPFDREYVFINRIYRDRDKMGLTHHLKVHNIFARYNGYIYESDRQHPSAQQGWVGYFPDRRQREVNCTMDADRDIFEFDELLRDFMYDRLWAKVNRGI